MSKERPTPIDQAERDSIARLLDDTLFVEAGAGTGKTSALVSRILGLIEFGRCSIDQIAAITFADSAASELRERVRLALETRSSDPELDQDKRQLCRLALENMESASIQTLHSFSGALLRQRPLEAGLPPDFETWSEVQSGADFERRWQIWLDQALDSETLGPALATVLTLGITLDNLRSITRAFHGNYDLLGEPVVRPVAPPREAARRLVESVGEIERLCSFSKLKDEDPLFQHALRLTGLCERLQAAGLSSDMTLITLFRWGRLSQRNGRQSDWETDPDSGANACAALKGLLTEMESLRVFEVESYGQEALAQLVDGIRRFVLEYAEDRRNEGTAVFQDLLVWARDLVQTNDEARSHFQASFRYVLVDEFQDTDPIQAEIACFLAADAGDASKRDWKTLSLVPGKLFVVGDPKQSIYRFRRADIEAVENVRNMLVANPTRLIQNFRSTPRILRWVNRLFEQWMDAKASPGVQAEYIPLAAQDDSAGGSEDSVYWMGSASEDKASQVRRDEGKNISNLVRKIKDDSWLVHDRTTRAHRPARYQDICLLLPTRTGLRILEQALEQAGVPFRVESQTLVLATQDVKDLLSCLRAIDSPADQISLVAALRSSAFGCSDPELLQFVEKGGEFNYLDNKSDDGPVSEGLDTLRRYHLGRNLWALEELVENFVRERRMVESGFGRARPREKWRRLRFIVDQARSYGLINGGSLRGFLDWMDQQIEERARIVESPVPESDDDAVRIMTVHASKGLEFPIVILTGLGSGESRQHEPVLFDRTSRSVEVGFGAQNDPIRFRTAGFDDVLARERLAESAESVRLAYVAATRARDHLVVSLFHSQNNKSCAAATITGFMEGADDFWLEISEESLLSGGRADAGQTTSATVQDDATQRSKWIEEREQIVRQASRPQTISATALAAIAKDESGQGHIPYRRGRGSTNLGRAVHSVLQTVDMESGNDLESVSRAQATVEGVAGRWEEIQGLARNALGSEAVRAAISSGRYFRELFVSAPINDALIEGFIDLLFEDENGLTIVDYKTDDVDSAEEIDRALEKYGSQMGAYAYAVQQATGMPVRRAILLFLRPKREVVFDDIGSLISRVEERAPDLLKAE
ncbi:MAG: UvrD-helicase domain-containing protein [Verrucomicrobiota bacterium]|nr:UvrD-helicase domain-containing protein [Verrucomicrobiota bacterium]